MLNKNRGVTLIEMLIALAISSIVLVGVVSFYAFAIHNSKRSLEIMRLDQELYLVMDVMAKDIRRSGYWANVQVDFGTGNLTNPFMQAETDIQINSSNNCILFTYDKNNDGTLPDLGDANDERYGFRLSNNIIQCRVSSGNFSCGNDTGWVDLTDPNIISVSNLNFVENIDSVPLDNGNTLDKRNIAISLTANLVSEATITRTLTRQIAVRNSKFIKGS